MGGVYSLNLIALSAALCGASSSVATPPSTLSFEPEFPNNTLFRLPSLNIPLPFTVQILPKGATASAIVMPKIVGGLNIDARPFMASIGILNDEFQTYSHLCGGSLITSVWVLTAAHCIGPNTVKVGSTVLVGGTDITRAYTDFEMFKVTEVHVHEQYDRSLFLNDVALLRLNGKAKSTPVRINTFAVNEIVGKRVTVSGWGAVSEATEESPSTTLRSVDLPIKELSWCQLLTSTLSSAQICAGGEAGKDACTGDSGGPLYVMVGNTGFQVGVVSYGVGCGAKGMPAVYTRTAPYVDWMVGRGVQFPETLIPKARTGGRGNKSLRCGSKFQTPLGPRLCPKTYSQHCCSRRGFCGTGPKLCKGGQDSLKIWRDDFKCGPKNLLPGTKTPAGCPSDAKTGKQCCSPKGMCTGDKKECEALGATNYAPRWRADKRCGKRNFLSDRVTVAECDPYSDTPCCGPNGVCGGGPNFCNAVGSINYSPFAQ